MKTNRTETNLKKVFFHTLGCKVNQYDTQAMLEQFLIHGYTQVFSTEEADVCVVNTCTVTSTADKKSLQIANRQKKLNKNCELIITGCMSQSRSDELLKTGARLILGTQFRHSIVTLLHKAIEENTQIVAVEGLDSVGFENLQVSGHNAHTRAVIKIQEGCNYNCSYCIIPSVRGKVRSRELNDIVAEAKSLVRGGYKEIILTGINLSCYGIDGKNADLCNVVEELNKIEGLKRIRISSLEPNLVTEEIANRLQQCKKLCPHFHLALQSGSNTVLNAMRRRYNVERFKKSVDILHKYFSNCAITTDIIVGFPAETEECFVETMEFVKQVNFQKIHVFPFSPRKNTDAANMPQIDSTIKKQRTKTLIALSDSLADAIYQNCIGKKYSVLLEEEVSPNIWKGYTANYMPVLINGNFKSGDMPLVKIVSVKKEVLYGEETNYGELHLL